METKTPTREELLERLERNRERKRQCQEEMKEFLRQIHLERTGEEPKGYFFL